MGEGGQKLLKKTSYDIWTFPMLNTMKSLFSLRLNNSRRPRQM